MELLLIARGYRNHNGSFDDIIADIIENVHLLSPALRELYLNDQLKKAKQRIREKFSRMIANRAKEQDSEIRQELDAIVAKESAFISKTNSKQMSKGPIPKVLQFRSRSLQDSQVSSGESHISPLPSPSPLTPTTLGQANTDNRSPVSPVQLLVNRRPLLSLPEDSSTHLRLNANPVSSQVSVQTDSRISKTTITRPFATLTMPTASSFRASEHVRRSSIPAPMSDSPIIQSFSSHLNSESNQPFTASRIPQTVTGNQTSTTRNQPHRLLRTLMAPSRLPLEITSLDLVCSPRNPPSSSHNPPSTSHIPPSTSRNTSSSSHYLPSTSHNPPSTSNIPPSTSRNPPSSSHNLPSTSRNLPSTSHNPPSTSHNPPSTSRKQSSASQSSTSHIRPQQPSSRRLPAPRQNINERVRRHLRNVGEDAQPDQQLQESSDDDVRLGMARRMARNIERPQCSPGTFRYLEDIVQKCEECGEGYYGRFCAFTCDCPNTSCSPLDGTCNDVVESNKKGETAGSTSNLYHKMENDRTRQLEECPPGTVRLSGDKEDHCRTCPSGYYGYKCWNSCQCSKHESSVLVDSQQVGSDTNRRSIQSTTNEMNLKDEKDTAATFFYKDILVITISCVVISVVIAMITKRAHHHCKRFEVSSVVENSNDMHVEAIEAGLDNDITESENKTDFSSKDYWSSFDSIVSESDGCLPVETEPVITQSCVIQLRTFIKIKFKTLIR
ncbi:MEGF10_11 [Mytilus edulis]|uniref:MEGF10_11 n=1 Tax=Mytilus edulis TaxID=6550 RepID=A0A8S3QKK8_MYTED|nr:MEGF10_11 [Mytilus edulis]